MDKFRFYGILLLEALLAPYYYLSNFLRWHFVRYRPRTLKERVPAEEKIAVCIHEWGGYLPTREKKIRVTAPFQCGLKFQLERFKSYQGKRPLALWLTLSEAWKGQHHYPDVKLLEVSNKGMDFSGYAAFYEQIKELPNHYVILTNTSVNKQEADFLDAYIDYMRENKSVGLLGVSYCSKMYQTLIRNNFTPHIQSFFILTTVQVLKEIVQYNKGFPGKDIAHKLLLIRRGEVAMSRMAMKLGYEIATVLEDGTVFKFDRSFLADAGRERWSLPRGDYRAVAQHPNSINPIK